ncbi:MAG: adenosylhomocysteinase [Desertimonas sp.]
MGSRIADGSLAASGHQRIDWARRRSPVLDGYVRQRLGDRLQGVRVAVVVHLEAKTAFLATVLADAGAEVVAAGSNPWTTRDDVAAALVERGVEVHSSRRSTMEVWEQDLAAVGATGPEYVIDDGAELTVRMARDQPDRFAMLRGVSEETTTGVARLRALADTGRLPFPAIAANDAACKHMFDNRYGTGQSTIQAILALTNLRMPGKRVVVIGYGWVGRGIATYAHALGARVTAVEIDPIRGLEAHTDGHDVADLRTALATADIVVTATGGLRAIGAGHLDAIRAGAVLANAGHHDLEIDVPALRAAASTVDEPRPGVARYVLDRDRPVYVLSEGALVNIAGGLGHPVEIMDLSFSVQAMGLHTLITRDLPAGVHDLPLEVDRAIAAAKLASRGIVLDVPDERQADTLSSILDVATLPPRSARRDQPEAGGATVRDDEGVGA